MLNMEKLRKEKVSMEKVSMEKLRKEKVSKEKVSKEKVSKAKVSKQRNDLIISTNTVQRLNKLNIAYFNFNKKVHLLNSDSYEKHRYYHNWTTHLNHFFGFNRRLLWYLLPILGYNKKILFTNTDEYYFICFRYLLRFYGYYFTLSWYLIYLTQRTYVLPLLSRGIRFYKKFPCRGQRTHTNYKSSRKVNKNIKLSLFKKKLNKRFIIKNFPSYNELSLFYYHRF